MSANILIVDDSVSIRNMVSFTLKSSNYSVTEACNGREDTTQHGVFRFRGWRALAYREQAAFASLRYAIGIKGA